MCFILHVKVYPFQFLYYQENKNWKEQVEVLLHENNILKRAIAIQHECQKTFDAQNEEVQQLKQMLSQYKEQIRILEVSNLFLEIPCIYL